MTFALVARPRLCLDVRVPLLTVGRALQLFPCKRLLGWNQRFRCKTTQGETKYAPGTLCPRNATPLEHFAPGIFCPRHTMPSGTPCPRNTMTQAH